MQTALDYLDSSVNSVQGDREARRSWQRRIGGSAMFRATFARRISATRPSALARYRQAITLLDDAIRRAPGDVDAVAERLVLYSRIGTMQADTGKLRDAVQTLEEGIRFGRPFAASEQHGPANGVGGVYLDASEARRNMNDYSAATRDAAESLHLYQAAVAVVRQIRRPGTAGQRLRLGGRG